jgi:hypothetical protein
MENTPLIVGRLFLRGESVSRSLGFRDATSVATQAGVSFRLCVWPVVDWRSARMPLSIGDQLG